VLAGDYLEHSKLYYSMVEHLRARVKVSGLAIPPPRLSGAPTAASRAPPPPPRRRAGPLERAGPGVRRCLRRQAAGRLGAGRVADEIRGRGHVQRRAALRGQAPARGAAAGGAGAAAAAAAAPPAALLPSPPALPLPGCCGPARR
jgi:hypothetical protein